MIERRIQLWIVVHLELPVHLEGALAALGFREQPVEAAGEVGALLLEALELRAAARDMCGVHVGALRLLAHRLDLQRQDREAVDHRARRLGAQPRILLGLYFGKRGEERFVDALDGIVPLLVVAVDRALVARDVGVRDVAAPREVLLLPEHAVVPVVGLDRGPDALLEARRRARCGEAVVVELDDLGGAGQAGHCATRGKRYQCCAVPAIGTTTKSVPSVSSLTLATRYLASPAASTTTVWRPLTRSVAIQRRPRMRARPFLQRYSSSFAVSVRLRIGPSLPSTVTCSAPS